MFYANSAMPNHYTAMGATAAAGALAAGRPAAVAAGVAVATLMRPNDGVALAAPLLLAALLVPAWRDRGRLAGPAAGLVAGALPWVVEAQLRFGGVRERLAEASGIQGGLRPVFSLPAHLTAWDGPLLCRPCGGDTVRPEALPWWLLLPSLVALGLWSARRGRAGAARTADGAPAPPAYRLAVLVALCCAAPYLFLVPYAAPRFLLPAYALLAVPAAAGLLLLVRVLPRPGPGRRRARAGATLLLALVPAHLVMQVTLVLGNARIQQDARADWHRITRVLRDLGVREPCVLKANSSFIPVAHTAGCRPARWRAPVEPDAVVLRRREPPGWARRWPSRPVPGTYNPGWTVAVRPGR
ncbi:hypothetical protein HOY81_03085 [Streptomyces sp. JJ36]|nr:hypothetical protein [Streptomyces sp. JJ36]